MAQHDYTIANQGFPAFRSDLNDALAAIVSNNSGATEPTTMFAHQMWVDTAANPSVLKIRNADNDAWITIGSIDQTGDTFTLVNLRTSGPVVFNDAGADVDFRVEGDTVANLLFVDASADSVGVGNNQPTIVDGNTNTKLTVGDTTTNDGALGVVTTARKGTSGNLSIGAFQFANTDIAGTEKRIAIVNGRTGTAKNDGVIEFFTASSGTLGERMRITSDGYLKASNNGSYNDANSTYHEISNTVSNDTALMARSANTGYTSVSLVAGCFRTASSAYNIIEGRSGDGSTNAFADTEFALRGDGNGYADGTWNNNGADYAEFFESANGQALTLGATVVLDGNKVRQATDQDPASAIIGVVRPKEPSKASMVVGNTAWNKWANKYLTDDFDRYIMEDHDVVEWEETITDEEGNTSTKQHSYESHNIPIGITVPEDATRKTHDDKGNKFQHYRLNPEWNPDSEYVNRENRPEWNIIGLLGQVKILKGQPVGDRWVKMRDISETVEEWFIR